MKKEVNKEYTSDLEAQGFLREPSFFQIVINNDDFTPMEFVVSILEIFFAMDRCKATDIMLEAHTKGSATFGQFTKDVAESKISAVLEYSKVYKHPLNCSMEVA